jgi:hypothetical protein
MIHIVTVFREDETRISQLIEIHAFHNDYDAETKKKEMSKKYYQIDYTIDVSSIEVK